MGLLQQIRSWFLIDDPQQSRAVQPTEQRDLNGYPTNDGWRGWGDFGNQSVAGVSVTRETALSVPAIWSAVDTIAKTLASLPFGLYYQDDNGSKPAKGHPVYNLVRIEPAPYYSSYSFRYALFAQACFGDSYAIIHRNGIGRPTELELVNSENVTLYQRDTGALYYVVRRTIGNRYVEEVKTPSEILHIKGLTLSGVDGMDVTDVHRDSIGMSIATERYGSYFYANNASVSGALVYPQPLNEQQYNAAKRKFSEQYVGISKAGKTVVLDAGVKYEKFSLNPQEAAMNETRNFQVNQASRIFGVPVPLLAQLDKATLNNMETMGIQFVTLCLRPYAVQAEQEFARKLLTRSELQSENYFFRFNFAGLLRGDTAARAAYYKQALGGVSTGIGWMTVNEVRELENFDRVDDGDEVFTAEKQMQAQSKSNGSQEMAQPQTDEENDTNDNENGTPQASADA